MLRNEIKDWRELEVLLKALIVPKPKVKDIRDFYNEKLDYLVTTSVIYRKHGKPNTIIGIAECFTSSMRDIFNYALKEDKFEILALLNRVIESEFTIFRCYVEIYFLTEDSRQELYSVLRAIYDKYEDHKKVQLDNYHHNE